MIERADAWTFASIALSTFVALIVLRSIAARVGLFDDGSDAPERKLQRTPVALVGGVAIAIGWLVSSPSSSWTALAPPFADGWRFEPRAFALAAAVAFGVGLADDLAPRGLSAPWKLAGQTLAGCALALALESSLAETSFGLRLATILGAIAAQNALNTFDNADGAVLSVAACGFCAALVPLAAAPLVVLPWNLQLVRPSTRAARVYIGDSGAHLIGIVLLATPVAWAALVLPALDLARVALERARAGQPIWRGDRRHLAHRLAAGGWSPRAVVVWLVCASLPPIAAARFAPASASAWVAASSACALVMTLALKRSPRSGE